MLNFFLILLFSLLNNTANALSQDFKNSLIQKENIDAYNQNDFESYQLNYAKPSIENNQNSFESYQQNYAKPSLPKIYGNLSEKDSRSSKEYDNSIYADYTNNFNSNKSINIPKKNMNFKDGKGYGYRIYDNSNRQSYFCNLAPLAKKNFTHDNNFNGIYFGVGLAKIDSSLDLQENENNIHEPSKINPPYKYNFSGSKVLPSIIIGQGRLFSSGLFLGQEYAINIGEFKITSNKIDNNKYKSISYLFSNNSYYSGKLGYNIFKNFLPYLKLSLSMSTSNFILKDNENHNSITSGGGIFFGGGFGIDISIQNHLRAIIDYTQFYDEGEKSSSYKKDNLYIQKKTLFETSNSFTRFSLVYKF